MYYEKRLAIPANTPASAPATETLPIHPGVVNQVDVVFPSGCAGLAHFQVHLWNTQLWPSNVNSDFSGDGVHISFTEDFEVVDLPFELTLIGWNLDDTYQHTVTLRVQITPKQQTLRYALERLGAGPGGPVTVVGG